MLNLFEILKYILPSLIVGGVSIYFMKSFFKNEKAQRFHQLKMNSVNESLPIRMQAYERIALLLDRVSLTSLTRRIQPTNDNIELHKNVLIQSINDEFDHNITQQIYITPETWNMILLAKKATIIAINYSYQKIITEKQNIYDYQLLLIKGGEDDENPMKLALLKLKTEIALEF
ncbi:MAG: hypothetical protein KAG96_02775 [Ichthyobacteriaceae bacterium]|nr:hypothetical protein [Ichthyobacteriaceae bacterium]